jgi:hypothetical protein
MTSVNVINAPSIRPPLNPEIVPMKTATKTEKTAPAKIILNIAGVAWTIISKRDFPVTSVPSGALICGQKGIETPKKVLVPSVSHPLWNGVRY